MPIDEVRLKVWAEQPRSFFDRATIDMDGTLTETTGACKAGMDIGYNGIWGYHPLVLSLAETGEVLSLVNRSGNRPSHEGAAAEIDRAIRVCRAGGFRQILVRGDTDFTQTKYLDRWDSDGVQFIFGGDSHLYVPNASEVLKQLDDIYRPILVRGGTDRHYLMVSRVAVVVFGLLLALGLALNAAL